MDRQTRIIFISLIILIGLLAGSNSYFVAKNLKNGANSSKEISSEQTTAIEEIKATDQASNKQSEVTKPASSSEKPSKPKDTYVIQKGETLFQIAQSQGVNWQDLAEANGLTDADKIQSGRTLIVPKGGQVDFIVDTPKAENLQKSTENGQYQFRLSPEETARSDAPPVYDLQVADNFVIKNNDANQGQAQVQAGHDSRNYLIKLIQPGVKGEKGIWAIESIKPI